MGYILGPVKPWVRTAADVVGQTFGVKTIYGVASRSTVSDHPLGLALDFMVYGDRAKGNSIAAYVQQNARKLNVKYVIWYQHIWSAERASEGWRAMENRGSVTANHMDHVHVSFNSRGSNVTVADFNIPTIPPISPINPFDLVPGTKDALPNTIQGAEDMGRFFSWLSDGHNWLRIALIVSGVVVIIFTLVRMGAVQTGLISSVASTAGKAVKPT